MARCDRNETNTQRSNLIELEFKEDSSAFGDARRFIVLDLRAVAGAAECSQGFSSDSKGSATLSSALVYRSTPSQHYHREGAGVADAISLSDQTTALGWIAGIKYLNG